MGNSAAEITSAAMTSGSGLMSSGLSAYANKKSQEAAMQYNAQEADKNRKWQEQQSNTAYQRAVKDMRAANLNPAMMYGGGSGGASSTPSGSTASTSAMRYDFSDILKGVTEGIASALTVKLDTARANKTNQETVNLKLQEQITNIKIPTITAEMHSKKAQHELDLFYAQIDAIQKRAKDIISAGSFISSETLKGAKSIYQKGKTYLNTLKGKTKESYQKTLKSFKETFGIKDK